jgi:hypothetical protein
MAPGDQIKDPEQLFKMLQDRYIEDKNLPTTRLGARFGEKERYVGRTPEGGYEDLLPEQAAPDKDKNIITLKPDEIAFDENGKVIARGKNVTEKDEKDKRKGVIVKPGERLVDQETGDVLFVAPGGDRALSDPDKKAREAASAKRVTKLKGMLSEIRAKYKGRDSMLDAILRNADKAGNFAELAELAKNGYERMKDRVKNTKTPEEREEALQDLSYYGELFNRMMKEEGLTPMDEGPPAPALGEGPTAGDYINNALGGGTQL